ncbi:MAG: hypothetical protein WBA54_13555 [Acidaminobacteraceae bacterium]
MKVNIVKDPDELRRRATGKATVEKSRKAEPVVKYTVNIEVLKKMYR